MNVYLLLHAASAIFLVVGGRMVYSIYRNPSGFFFFLFTILAAVWLSLYYAFFAGIFPSDVLLVISRVSFALSVAGEYSLLFFIREFRKDTSPVFTKATLTALAAFMAVMVFYVSGGGIISTLEFSKADDAWREVYGWAYPFHILVTTFFVPLLVKYFLEKMRTQGLLNRIRLKLIVAAFAVLMLSMIVLQMILPLLGIWIMEKAIALFFVGFVASVLYVVKRYYYSGIGFGFGKIFAYAGSAIGAGIVMNIASRWVSSDGGYWTYNDDSFVIEAIVAISLFALFYRALGKAFSGATARSDELKAVPRAIRTGMSSIVTEPALQKYVSEEVKRVFKARSCEVRTFPKGVESELRNFFESDPKSRFFINDIVFIEEHRKGVDVAGIQKEFPGDLLIAFPIRGSDEKSPCEGVLVLGPKKLGGFYDSGEIRALSDIAFDLWSQMKFIEVYRKSNDLSVNLDRKVDEKTIEYNTLINQQKEFISVISHEIKAPITNAVFQSDSILDDLETGLTEEDLREELGVLNSQLVRAGELLTKLFSVQYYDTRAVSLFKEGVQIGKLLRTEFEIYSRMHPEIRFVDRISAELGTIRIDRIQFQQVLSNLLQNAVKFVSKEGATIVLTAFRDGEFLHVSVEDNGAGFADGTDADHLFDRYATGSGGAVGLGMGLYLCRKIVQMHGGEIHASPSSEFSGAKFSIRIPVE
jgi:signal transduction histidine kinase